MKITVLGSGTSHGVPMIGCDCPVCSSSDPKNRRSRASVLIETGNTTLLIDASPDFREQALRARLTSLDAILFTHAHADHVFGLDDIRPLCTHRAIPVYGNRETLAELRETFGYIFRETQRGGGKPRIELREIDDRPVQIQDMSVVPVPLKHGTLNILGFRTNDFAYCTDCSAIPEESYGRLTGLRLLVIDALRYRPHETHFSLEEALQEIEKIRPEKALLTHICHDLDHAALERELPEHVAPAYDGLVIEL